MKRIIGVLFLIAGGWALVAPQANLGLQELRWMSRHVFPGEAILGCLSMTLGYLLFRDNALQNKS